MIILTGAGGFIGSVILKYFNQQGIDDICIVDDLPTGNQFKNLIGKKYRNLYSTKENLIDFSKVDCIIHFGANSSTIETDWMRIYHSNVISTRYWSDISRKNNIKFIFASSAAIYGNGQGPENHYAFSKLLGEQSVSDGVILRLFNVYGPNEYHKGRMASTIYHWYHQIKENNHIKIFNNSKNYKRDFIWVEDVAKTVYYFYKNYFPGIYDLGTGISSSFYDLSDILLKQFLNVERIFIEMPKDLVCQYQKNTIADVSSLEKIGIDTKTFCRLDDGVVNYLNFLKEDIYY